MNISPAEAIRRYNVSKPTLYSDMKDGKLSFTLDDRKRRKINIAELDRIYDKRDEEGALTEEKSVKSPVNNTQSNVKSTAEYSMGRLELEVEYLKRELTNRQEETERWKEAFDKAQSTADKITALLEDQSVKSRHATDKDEWKKTLTELETRIANQEKTTQEKEAEAEKIIQQNKVLKKALTEEQSKGFFKKLFG